MLSSGEETTLPLGWNFGTGRAPQYYFSSNPEPKETAYENPDRPQHKEAGITLSLNDDQQSALRQQIRAANSQAHVPRQERRGLTTCALNIAVADDARPGMYRRYIHNISGTARMMVLSAEVLIIVEDPAVESQ